MSARPWRVEVNAPWHGRFAVFSTTATQAAAEGKGRLLRERHGFPVRVVNRDTAEVIHLD